MASYQLGFGQLLIRGGRTPLHPTRIDIVFQDVRAMEVRTTLNGLCIEDVDPHFADSTPSKPLAALEV